MEQWRQRSCRKVARCMQMDVVMCHSDDVVMTTEVVLPVQRNTRGVLAKDAQLETWCFDFAHLSAAAAAALRAASAWRRTRTSAAAAAPASCCRLPLPLPHRSPVESPLAHLRRQSCPRTVPHRQTRPHRHLACCRGRCLPHCRSRCLQAVCRCQLQAGSSCCCRRRGSPQRTR